MLKSLLATLLCVITLGVFWGARNAGYVWDDEARIASVSSGHSTNSQPDDAWALMQGGFRIPLSREAVALVSKGPHNATGAIRLHRFDMALHLLSVLFVFAILTLFVPVGAAFVGGLLFAIHPLQVETAVWASALPALLGGCLSLFALWQYLVFAREKDTTGRDQERGFRRFYVATLAFVLALLAYPLAVVVPFLAFCLERLTTSSKGSLTPRRQRTAIPLLTWVAVALPFAAWTVVNQQAATSGLASAPFWQRPLVAGDALAFYTYKLFWPLSLSPDYGRTPAVALGSWWSSIIWLAPLALFIALWLRARQKRVVALASLVFFLALLPTLGFAPFSFQHVSTVADRFAYLAMLGPAIGLAYAVARSRTMVPQIACLLVLIVCGVLSFRQAGTWRDDATLFAHTLAVNPGSTVAHNRLGSALAREGRFAEALPHFQAALKANANDARTYFNLGEAYAGIGKNEQAIAEYQRALALQQHSAVCEERLGEAYQKLGRTAEAKASFAEAISMRPDYAEARENLGRILLDSGDAESAIAALNQALRSDPQNAEAQALAGQAYSLLHNPQDAALHFTKALALKPHHAAANKGLADVFFAAGKFADALPHYEEALAANPNDPMMHFDVAVILTKEKRWQEAIDHLHSALAVNPTFADAHNELGVALNGERKLDEAVAEFKTALAEDPRLADAHYNLGNALAEQGLITEAKRQYYEAIYLDHDHALAHYHLGELLASQHLVTKAIGHYTEALKVRPDDERIKEALGRARQRLKRPI